MANKRPFDQIQSPIGSHFSFGEYREHADEERKVRRRKPPLPPYKATMTELANDAPANADSAITSIAGAVLQKIKKCLDRANHSNTSEHEAKTAFHVASRLVGHHNVTQAEVLAHEPPENQKQYAGQSIVCIIRVDGNKSKGVRRQYFVDTLDSAMKHFLECEYYTNSGIWSLEVHFYGVAQNTITAAIAFESAYNLVVEWARPYKGTNAKNSYYLGISNELRRTAIREQEQQEAQAKENELAAIANKENEEEAERRAQLERLEPVPMSTQENESSAPVAVTVLDEEEEIARERAGEEAENDIVSWFDNEEAIDRMELDSPTEQADCYSSEDEEGYSRDSFEPDFKIEDGDDAFINNMSIEDAINNFIKPEPIGDDVKQGLESVPIVAVPEHRVAITSEQVLEVQWASHTQLVLFRDTANRIAEEYIKSQGVILCDDNATGPPIRDLAAYDQGRKDGKKIDVRGKRIGQ